MDARVECDSDHRDGYILCWYMQGRVIAYFLDSASWIHGVCMWKKGWRITMIVETATLHESTCTEKGVNLRPGFIKLDPLSNTW